MNKKSLNPNFKLSEVTDKDWFQICKTIIWLFFSTEVVHNIYLQRKHFKTLKLKKQSKFASKRNNKSLNKYVIEDINRDEDRKKNGQTSVGKEISRSFKVIKSI